MSDFNEPTTPAGKALHNYYIFLFLLPISAAFITFKFWHGIVACAIFGLGLGIVTAVRTWNGMRDNGQRPPGIILVDLSVHWGWKGATESAMFGLVTCGIAAGIRYLLR